MRSATEKQPILLGDEQVREFIVNGYVVLQPSVPNNLHETICRKLTTILTQGDGPGNNVLPRVAEMRHILNSPEVRGALISILGEDYIEHPHRHCHYLAPAAEPHPEPDIQVAKNCHQDAYTPLGRPRQHYPRYARVMYYPQDTPIELGPTHVIPGTQYHKTLTDEDRRRTIPMAGKAGTVSITHFDVGHAAGVNLINQPRHMIKFIYVRGSEPLVPSWNCQSTQWHKPNSVQAHNDLELAWSHIWDWMCGKRHRYESFQGQTNGNIPSLSHLITDLASDIALPARLTATNHIARLATEASEAIPTLLNMLDTDHQAARVAAIYTLGSIGEPALKPLITRLRDAGRREDQHPAPRAWNEGAISMEDAAHALAAIGPAAVSPLTDLLADTSEWTRINAAFALGEMDSHAKSAVPNLTTCLNDTSYRVVRTATDSLGSIRQSCMAFISPIGHLLTDERPGWDEVLTRNWTVRDQVRTNAAMAFARLGNEANRAEDILCHALDDPCGHVGAFAMDALRRIDSQTAAQAVMNYLLAERWDESITKARQF